MNTVNRSVSVATAHKLRSVVREFLRNLRAALREVFRPAPFEDEDPQSTADATAARTKYIRDHRPDRR